MNLRPVENTRSKSAGGRFVTTAEQNKDSSILPPEFTHHLRDLFDVLDSDSKGYISIADIEKHWQRNRAEPKKLGRRPRGVSEPQQNVASSDVLIDSLKEVAPVNGLLSFQRFCCGIKIALCKGKNGNGVKNYSGHRRQRFGHALRPRSYLFAVDHDDLDDSCSDVTSSVSEEEHMVPFPRSTDLTCFKGSDDSPDEFGCLIQVVPQNDAKKDALDSRDVASWSSEDIKLRDRSFVKDNVQELRQKSDTLDPVLRKLDEQLSLLKTGLDAAERAKDWYLKQIALLLEKKYTFKLTDGLENDGIRSKDSSSEKDLSSTCMTLESNREKIKLLNNCLKGVCEQLSRNRKKEDEISMKSTDEISVGITNISSGKSTDENNNENSKAVQKKLEEQAQKIELLEKEKSALVKELFQLKAELSTNEYPRGPFSPL